jgi:hypothetical protein
MKTEKGKPLAEWLAEKKEIALQQAAAAKTTWAEWGANAEAGICDEAMAKLSELGESDLFLQWIKTRRSEVQRNMDSAQSALGGNTWSERRKALDEIRKQYESLHAAASA